MSLCRFAADCDLYVFETTGGIECCGCRLPNEWETGPRGSQKFATRTAFLAHLEEHEAAGHSFPTYVADQVCAQLEALGDEVKDVYFRYGASGLECRRCFLAGHWPTAYDRVLTFDTEAEAYRHLLQHRAEGSCVPEDLFRMLAARWGEESDLSP